MGISTALRVEDRRPATPAKPQSLFRRSLQRFGRHPLTRRSVAAAFEYLQRFGVSVVPVHFYFPVPDIRRIPAEQWSHVRESVSFDLRLPQQAAHLRNWCDYRDEWTFWEEPDSPFGFHLYNGFFETVDAEVAYSIVRERRPARIIEIGGGNTTRLLSTALQRNTLEGSPGELFTIEPHPGPALKAVDGFATNLIEEPVQNVPLSFFATLKAGDILFIDSSHVATIASDVVYEILQILPSLRPGVIVHLHDIFLPFEYPEKFVRQNLCFWNEQYLLEAFLSFNPEFRILWASSAMQAFQPEVLREAFPLWQGSYERMPHDCALFAPTRDGRNVWPCSFWMERVS